MNMRNINVLTALSVPGKTVLDNFINSVLSNGTTKIVLPAPKNFRPESVPNNFNIASVSIVEKGMSADATLISDLISAFRHESKKGESNE
ncbi:TPA: conjugal transfer protein TrbD [Escherichia coli]|nr:conjugal transfer protein TrbD [Escherichia coli]HCQ8899640.1 conjugal transfer protein TrbD [Escherichia coli]HCQ9034896.1 conjugal transfer protein TrbD [Escherichia coli]